MYPNLENQTPQLHCNGMQFRLTEINRIKCFFMAEIQERKKKKMSKTLSKYIVAYDNFKKTLLLYCCIWYCYECAD